MQKPSFWRLCGAYLIDFIITFFVAWILWKVFWICFPNVLRNLGERSGACVLLIISTVCVLIPNLLYFSECENLWNQTLGKRCFGVKAFSAQQTERRTILFAYGIDFLLLIPTLTFCLGVGLFIQAIVCFDCNPGVLYHCVFWGMISVYFGAIILYFAILEHFFGKTLGKKLMGLTVVQNVKKEKGG